MNINKNYQYPKIIDLPVGTFFEMKDFTQKSVFYLKIRNEGAGRTICLRSGYLVECNPYWSSCVPDDIINNTFTKLWMING